jgi:hypothetical protein
LVVRVMVRGVEVVRRMRAGVVRMAKVGVVVVVVVVV